jgi:hypothetical protein
MAQPELAATHVRVSSRALERLKAIQARLVNVGAGALPNTIRNRTFSTLSETIELLIDCGSITLDSISIAKVKRKKNG